MWKYCCLPLYTRVCDWTFLMQLNRRTLKNKGGDKEIPFYSKPSSSKTMIYSFLMLACLQFPRTLLFIWLLSLYRMMENKNQNPSRGCISWQRCKFLIKSSKRRLCVNASAGRSRQQQQQQHFCGLNKSAKWTRMNISGSVNNACRLQY